MARLKQAKGVGTLIALTCLLTLEDAQRFRKSREVGCYVGLQPDAGTRGRVNRSSTSVKKAIHI